MTRDEYLRWGAASTCVRGDRLPQTKLNWEAVDAIRKNARGKTMKQLAAEYGVHYRTIEKIMYYETWAVRP